MNTQLRRARNRQMFIFLLVCLGIYLYCWQDYTTGKYSNHKADTSWRSAPTMSTLKT